MSDAPLRALCQIAIKSRRRGRPSVKTVKPPRPARPPVKSRQIPSNFGARAGPY
jgi:hypothetical protein